MVLWLTSQETAPLLEMPAAIEATEAAFLEQGRGLTVNHAPYALSMEPANGQGAPGPTLRNMLRVVSGGLLGSGKVAMRLSGRGGARVRRCCMTAPVSFYP